MRFEIVRQHRYRWRASARFPDPDAKTRQEQGPESDRQPAQGCHQAPQADRCSSHFPAIGAVGEAAANVDDGEIAHLILLAAVAAPDPENMTGTKLFIVAEGDSFRRSVEAQFRRAAEPKRMEILPGNAHAQHIFRTPTGDALTELIVAELTQRP